MGGQVRSHAQGQSFLHTVQGRGKASHLRRLKSWTCCSEFRPWVVGSWSRVSGTFRRHFPFPTVPHSLLFVQNMLICMLNALRRPAGGEPTLFNCLLYPNNYYPQNFILFFWHVHSNT